MAERLLAWLASSPRQIFALDSTLEQSKTNDSGKNEKPGR